MEMEATDPVSDVTSGHSNRVKKLLIALLVAGIVVVGTVTAFFLLRKVPPTTPFQPQQLPTTDDFVKLSLPQREPPFFILAATTTGRFGINPQESFTLLAKAPVNREFLRQNLVTNVETAIIPQDQENKAFTIQPTQALDTDELLQIKLQVKGKTTDNHTFDRDYSWSYQTQGKFRITSHIPGDKKTDVPVNTGIEITFSQDDYNDPQNFVEIKPAIEFRLERHAETLAIVPLKPLLPQTIYTVTLKKGLNLASRHDPISQDFSFSFQTAPPQQQQQRSPYLSLANNFVQTSLAEPAQIKVFSSNWDNDPIKAQIYQFPSADLFLASRKQIDQIVNSWMHYYPEQEPADTNNLSLVSEAELMLKSNDNLEYLQLPSELSAGFYLVRLLYDDNNKLEQLWLQVTDLAAYVSVGKRQTVIWANNLATGQPAQQAVVQPAGTVQQSTTNEQGVAVFDTPSSLLETQTSYIQITSQHGAHLVLPAISNEEANRKTADDYWSYLYHERRLYRPTDTLYFWGVAKERDTNQPPATVVVGLDSSYYYSEAASPPIVEKTVTLNPDGTFFGSLELVEVPPAWYTLALRAGEAELASSGLQVIEFVKPEMKIEVTTDQKAIFSSEKLAFTARATFFDGTPVANVPLKITEEFAGNTEQLTTDEQGEITYSYQAKHSDYGLNSYQCLTFTPALAQEGVVEGHGCVLVFNQDLALTTASSQQDNLATLKATVHRVDLARYNADPAAGYQGKPAAGQTITFDIRQSWWERVEEGTYYDFIEKTTRPRYKYIHHEQLLETKQQTTNTAGQTTIQFALEEQKSYEVVVHTLDSKERKVTRKAYFYFGGARSYSREPENEYPQLTLMQEENIFSLGEEVALKIQLGDDQYPDSPANRFLFIVAQRGRQTTTVMDEPAYSFTFEQTHIPNVFSAAVIFTGRHYQVVHAPCLYRFYCSYYSFYQNFAFPGLNIVYKKEDRKLALTIDYDQPAYQPGEQATITVRVENKDHQPTANAPVNLVLVDQALEAIGGVRVPSILATLYATIDSGIYYSYHSHQPLFPPESQAEMGGGGGERSIFKDTAFFGSQTTDAEGRAVFSVQLPDNITAWRVYAQAATAALEAGQQQSSLIVTQDFFVVPAFPREFLTKDKPLLLGNAFGRQLEAAATVNYQATFLQGEQQLGMEESAAKADAIVAFPFPQLVPGAYQLALEGTADQRRDKIILPFKVRESRFAMQQQQTKTLSAQQTLNRPAAGGILPAKPFTLVVSDAGKGKYYWQLTRFCYQTSNRLEKNLARLAANSLLQATFEENTCPPQQQDLAKFQSPGRGLSQVWWGASELKSTVWAISVDPTQFEQEKLAAYLTDQFNQTGGGTVQKILAAWGLTSLNQPRVSDLRFLAAQAVSFEEKIFAALALAQAGEIETARELYRDILADYAYTSRPYVRIQTQSTKEQNVDKMVQESSMALLLGVLVEPEYNTGLYAYIRDFNQDTQEVVLDLAQIAFIKDQLRQLPPESTSLKYTSAARTLEKEMTKGGNLTIHLAPEERENYTVRVEAGKAEVTTSYFIGAEGLTRQPPDPRLKISRTYRKTKGEPSPIVPGDIIEVSLSFDFDLQDSPRGAYTITDILPSGLAYLPNPHNYGLSPSDWARKHEQNVLSFRVYNLPWWLRYHDKKITYYARVKGAGVYEAEPALFQSELDPSVFTYTVSEQVTINKSKL